MFLTNALIPIPSDLSCDSYSDCSEVSTPEPEPDKFVHIFDDPEDLTSDYLPSVTSFGKAGPLMAVPVTIFVCAKDDLFDRSHFSSVFIRTWPFATKLDHYPWIWTDGTTVIPTLFRKQHHVHNCYEYLTELHMLVFLSHTAYSQYDAISCVTETFGDAFTKVFGVHSFHLITKSLTLQQLENKSNVNRKLVSMNPKSV